MTNGRRKGSVAEREIASLLQLWWQHLEPECRFVRTPLSGGWGGPEVRAGFRASGDVMTTAQRFPFTVEVKRREVSFREFLAGRPSPVWSWWRQAQEQAREQGGEPALFFRTNRTPWRLLLRAKYVESLGPIGHVMCAEMSWHSFLGRWPASRGDRPVGFAAAGALWGMRPKDFALAEPRTGVRRTIAASSAG
jgi:hypothetical protein